MRCTVRFHAAIAKCRRKQYNGVRAAAQFLSPLLCEPAIFSQQTRDDVSPMKGKRSTLAKQLVGVPFSLAHEGPLCGSHLHVFSGIALGELARMFEHVVGHTSEAPPDTTHVARVWPSVLQAAYGHILLREAKGEKEAELFPKRAEAGLYALRVFAQVLDEHKEFLIDHTALFKRWQMCIDDYTLMLPDRSFHHELKNLPQEIGIGELISSISSRIGGDAVLQTVIDVGGGNGFLAAQLAERFQCESIIVDPFRPKHAIDNPEFPHWSKLPRQRPRVMRSASIRRIESRFADIRWDSHDVLRVNFDHCALIAKHLCGTAIDNCFRHLSACHRMPRIMVVVPCCFNKGKYEEYCNPSYVFHTAGVNDSPSWNRWTRLTDWNESCSQQQSRHASTHPAKRRKKLNDVLPCMDDIAQMVESIVNQGRLMWLRQKGYDAFLVTYVPHCVTPKNRAIVAVRREPIYS